MQRKNMIERKQSPEQKGRTILRNILITVGIMGAATIVCLALQHFSEADTHVPLLFVLAVVIVARFTEGYVYGILSAMAAVVLVNYVFTYPYFELNFSITGYPLTFVVMLATAVMVSALTTQIKWQEQIRLEVEKEKTRANLLRAVSHDIRTPLTSIQASASGILDNYDALGRQEKVELLEGIRDESRWLIRMVENLLSITRINGGPCAASDDLGGRRRGRRRGGWEVPEAVSADRSGNKHAGGGRDGSDGRHFGGAGFGKPDGKFCNTWRNDHKNTDIRAKTTGTGSVLRGG